MSEYSEQDLKYASEFREGVHREALAIVRKTRPHVTEVVDRHPVEDYFQEHWDYPGKRYAIVAIPSGYGSREALVDAIVRDTLTADGPSVPREPGRRKLGKQLDSKPDGYQELFTVDVDQTSRSCRAVGADAEGRHILEHYEEYNIGSAIGSTAAYYVLTDAEYRRWARLALVNGHLSEEAFDHLTAEPKEPPKQEEDPFFTLLAEYPRCVIDYRIVPGSSSSCRGCEAHRLALKQAFQTLSEDDWDCAFDLIAARGKQIGVGELFAPPREAEELNYRGAFLHPPHGVRYTDADFDRLNAALFPKGTDGLEVYRWTTDWSNYFDDGHEWWGTLCLTVYDKRMGRYAVILASATD